ncbi:hypothetical protein C942_04171 [Photobacterium marinum]|uniref:Uncharacterized protein n=1 Tax=Photobacterium marinum TaxID=1056511 RepID=L8JDY0_9GAMM|nr:hypothetical protein C942_04171 [Photobacterium marinum]
MYTAVIRAIWQVPIVLDSFIKLTGTEFNKEEAYLLRLKHNL